MSLLDLFRPKIPKATHPKQKYCFMCGWPMSFPRDEKTCSGYNMDTGERYYYPCGIRTTDLQYCMRDNLYIIKQVDGTWKRHYDIMSILHLIA